MLPKSYLQASKAHRDDATLVVRDWNRWHEEGSTVLSQTHSLAILVREDETFKHSSERQLLSPPRCFPFHGRWSKSWEINKSTCKVQEGKVAQCCVHGSDQISTSRKGTAAHFCASSFLDEEGSTVLHIVYCNGLGHVHNRWPDVTNSWSILHRQEEFWFATLSRFH